MEEEETVKIYEQAKTAKIAFNSVSHDNDASTMSHILDAFPDCKKRLDKRHTTKNFYKKVIWN